MGKIVGIDLGTTNSLVATVDSGIPLVIAGAEGGGRAPSVVPVPGRGSEPLVGEAASRVRVVRPAETVYSVKRFMGRRGAGTGAEGRLGPYPVSGRGSGAVTIKLQGRRYTPEEISAEILKKLKQDAEKFLGEGVESA